MATTGISLLGSTYIPPIYDWTISIDEWAFGFYSIAENETYIIIFSSQTPVPLSAPITAAICFGVLLLLMALLVFLSGKALTKRPV